MSRNTTPMNSLSKAAQKVAASVGAVAVLGMLLFVVVNAFARFVFNASIAGSSEYVSLWLMPLTVAIGVVLAAMNREHLEVDILAQRWRGLSRRLAIFVRGLVVIVFLGLTVFVSLPHAQSLASLGESGTASDIPIWPFRFILTLGLLCFALLVLVQTVKDLRGKHNELRIEDGDND